MVDTLIDEDYLSDKELIEIINKDDYDDEKFYNREALFRRIAKTLILKDPKNVLKINSSILTYSDWIDILLLNPCAGLIINPFTLFDFSNRELQNELKRLVMGQPGFSYLIDFSKYSGNDWVSFLIHRSEFDNIADYSKLSIKNWNELLEYRPDLEKKKKEVENASATT